MFKEIDKDTKTGSKSLSPKIQIQILGWLYKQIIANMNSTAFAFFLFPPIYYIRNRNQNSCFLQPKISFSRKKKEFLSYAQT